MNWNLKHLYINGDLRLFGSRNLYGYWNTLMYYLYVFFKNDCGIHWLARKIYFKITIKDTGLDYRFRVFANIVHSDGAPKRCINCEHDKFEIKVTYQDETMVLEKEASCKKCETKNGYWAYGNWML